jgi:CheY-like chemotaxis protein
VKTILIIDDNPAHALLTIEAFHESFEIDNIVHITGGEEALDYLFRRGQYENRTEDNPGMILLDLNMPRIGGFQMLDVLKSTEELKSIPIIMLTLSDNEQDVNRCYQKGANAYVLKRFDYHRYREEIRILGEFWGFTNQAPNRYDGSLRCA